MPYLLTSRINVGQNKGRQAVEPTQTTIQVTLLGGELDPGTKCKHIAASVGLVRCPLKREMRNLGTRVVQSGELIA